MSAKIYSVSIGRQRRTAGARALSGFVLLFGLVCCVIGLAHLVLGPVAIIGSLPVNATMDGEDRFFGMLFFSFGAALTWTGQDLRQRRTAFMALMGAFFLGGCARAVSVLAVGWPHPVFIGLGILELLLPPLLAWLSDAVAEPL